MPDQIDDTGAEHFSNISEDVGDIAARIGLEDRGNALLPLHDFHSIRKVGRHRAEAVEFHHHAVAGVEPHGLD